MSMRKLLPVELAFIREMLKGKPDEEDSHQALWIGSWKKWTMVGWGIEIHLV